MSLARALLAWYRQHKRPLPWRQTTDPYAIIVSEFMLQQTQVDRVITKYNAWLAAFPTWKSLAMASQADVLRAWSGLGYNNRAIRLQRLARVILENGFPRDEDSLRLLPGIGPYTAGAIRVFAFNEPGACIDVNVARVIKRVSFTKRQRPSKERVDAEFLSSFPDKKARDFGNALMDFGSLVCTATRPRCSSCPLFNDCKSKGERPEEDKERIQKRQSTFLHSNRWWRGQILKSLGEKQHAKQQLFKRIGTDKAAYQKALRQLQTEGLVAGVKRLRLADSPR